MLGQGTEALSIVLIFDGASSGSTRAQWVELAPFLEIVAWGLGSKPCPALGASGKWPRLGMAPGQVLGTSCTEALKAGSGRCSAEDSAALLPGHWILAFSHICVLSLHHHPLYMARMDS